MAKVYVRKASGLVRGIGLWGALSICLAGIAPVSGKFLGHIALFSWPGTMLTLWLSIGAVLCLIHAYQYSLIGAIMPRSGGDYVFTSRGIHMSIGFMENLTLIIFLSIAMGGIAPMLVVQGISNTLWVQGVVFNDPSLIDQAFLIASPEWIFIGGTIALLGTSLILFLPMKVWIRIIEFIVGLGIAVTIIVAFQFITTSHTTFVDIWNSYQLLPSYKEVISKAAEKGAQLGVPTSLGATLSAGLLAFWLYFGYIFAAFFAGEVKEHAKSIPIAIMGSIIIVFVLDIAIMAPAVQVLGHDFIISVGWLFFATPGVLPLMLVQYDVVSCLLFPNLFWIWIVGITMLLQHVFIFMAYLVLISRCMFAWSFDRILPEKISYVNRWGSPIIAILIAFVIAEIGLWFSTYTVIPVYFNWLFAFALVQIIVGVAAVVFPFVKKEIFDVALPYARFKIAGKIPILSVIGIINIVMFGFMAYSMYMVPAIAGPITLTTIASIISVFIGAGVLYGISRWFRLRKEGIDITMAAKEIPPA